MRILVTGSREWDRPDVVWSCLDIVAAQADAIGDEVTVVHGACPRGADAQADHWARLRSRDGKPTRVEWHPADRYEDLPAAVSEPARSEGASQ